MAEWFTIEGDTPEHATTAQERLLAAWADAPIDNLEVCGMLLEVAREQVVAFAPDPYDVDGVDEGDPTPPTPTRYVYAQLKQTENLWNAGRVSSSGEVGMDTFTFTPRPLDKTIRAIIRPMGGLPNVS